MSFNRTILELKCAIPKGIMLKSYAFNRTILELKSLKEH